MKLFNGKKGLDGFSLVLTMIAIIVLTLILMGVILKYNSVSVAIGGKAGTNAFNVFSSYDKGDTGLLYLDNAAKLSLREAAYELGKNGFYGNSKTCGDKDGLGLWRVGSSFDSECRTDFSDKACMPENADALEDYFSEILTRHIIAFNEKMTRSLLEENNIIAEAEESELSSDYEYRFSKVGERTQVLGLAKNPYVVIGDRVKYSVKPSFKESIDVNVYGDLEEIKSKVKEELVHKISSKNVDKDYLSELVSEIDDERLSWAVESIRKFPLGSCNARTHCWVSKKIKVTDCTIQVQDCVETDIVDGDGNAFLKCDNQCGFSDKIIQERGDLKADRFDAVATISVKIQDDDYENGVKTFAYAEENKEYDYRFGLNWVEIGDFTCCIDGECSRGYSTELVESGE